MAETRTFPVENPRSGIGRRQVVRGLLTGAGAGLAIPGLAKGHPLAGHVHHAERIETAQHKARDAADSPEFLEAYPFGMLETLGERIVPGSAAAGCARFVDSLLAVGTRDERQRFLTSEEGLRELGYDGPVLADTFPGCPHPDGHREGHTE